MCESEWTLRLMKGLEACSAKTVPRVAMTPDKLLLLKLRISQSNWDSEKRRLVWMAACFAFAGALRSAEYLPASVGSFDRKCTLLNEDVSLEDFVSGGQNMKMILLNIKEPKELKKANSKIQIELFQC